MYPLVRHARDDRILRGVALEMVLRQVAAEGKGVSYTGQGRLSILDRNADVERARRAVRVSRTLISSQAAVRSDRLYLARLPSVTLYLSARGALRYVAAYTNL